MKRIVKILLVINLAVVSLLIFSSCQDATISPYEQPIVKPIVIGDYPLEIGNYWKYVVNYSDREKNDTFLVSIISKNSKLVFDTTINEYSFTEKYYDKEHNPNGYYLGKIFNYKNTIYSTEDNRIDNEMPKFVRIIRSNMAVGEKWLDTLCKDAYGNPAIAELRKTEAKIDTTFNDMKFKNCYLTSRYWIYYSQGKQDTIKVGREIYCPSIGIIYRDLSVDTVIYEKRIIKDYMISIKQ